ncbi:MULTISPECIES: glycosyltransferase family 2 protein [unclassified Lysobacter]|uniref:glycosyltransferase family 2 protein n=1 Tax=unclassified Lysobacter TaxID=2635362 RepID=UPI001BE895DD|nr:MULTISPECIES: glycosyltransferase family 2 protein [unclassified Lysobacter]MBT2747864.1 glycosyltransferase family 2 protein [Lysobacter sp. ISL-42]MBT2753796.1 glycosyltransferase family 2 protein [Lysobacter sp. ISL-50]MBT2779084.1 glycosyltransferase family 2 protein [Lysobacter sp. ISL-54]
MRPPAQGPAFKAVVVSYRSAATIDECLERLRACDGVVAIRVVDNQSDDGTLDIIQRHASLDPRLRFIANPDNPGFSVGCNQGAADLEPAPEEDDWLAFVNPDCMVEPDTLQRLHALAAPLGQVLISADLVNEQGERDAAVRRRDPDFGAMLAGIARPWAAPKMAVAPDDAQALQVVEATSGALMLMPRHLFARIGGFDEDYRLHAEDLDLCRRVRQAGGTIAVANAVRVMHVRGVSSRSRPFFVEWNKHRGLWRYFRKFEAPRRGALVRAGVFAAIWLRFPIAALRAAMR